MQFHFHRFYSHCQLSIVNCQLTHIVLAVFLLFGCANSPKPDVTHQDSVQTITPAFTRPDPPAMITDQNLRLEYVIKHYWDNFNFADTAYVPTPDITEQAWVNFIDLLFRVPPDKAQAAMKDMMTKSAEGSQKLLLYFTELADKYLYDPNSPARNEELYIPVLEVLLQSPALDDTEKIRPQMRLDWALKNRMGAKATDFQYTGITGQTGTLYQVNTAYILLFFNNPECTSCVEHIQAIRQSVIINRLISERKLTIVSIYPDREVENEWKKNITAYPAEWIKGYDPSFTISEKYDLKASPTLYLLDKDKTVLLKDASLPLIDNYLTYMLQQQ